MGHFVEWFCGRYQYFCEFDGEIGENYTGAAAGGLAETSSGYLVSYHWQPTGSQWDVYIAHIAKDDFEVRISTLTEGVEGVDSTNPILAPMGLDKGYILWNKAFDGIIPTKTLCYAKYNADGKTSAISEAEAPLSDCQPIPYKDGILWYTADESVPTFYYLCDFGLTAIPAGGTTETLFSEFSDLQVNFWYAGYVERVLRTGLMRGTDDTHFDPTGTVTLAEVIALAARHNSEQDRRTIQEVPGAWYMSEYNYCLERHIIDPSEYPLESMEEAATRYQVVEILRSGMSGYEHYKAINNVDTIPDVDRLNPHKYDVYSWYEAGIIEGDSEHYFHGDATITRAEISAILCRMDDPSMRIHF